MLSANIVTLVLGVLKTLALPLLLGATEFGYWQVYAFYVSYTWILGLGFTEGTYLRYGGVDYEDLPLGRMRGSVRLLLLLQCGLAGAISLAAFLEADPTKRLALVVVALNVPASVLFALLMSLLQTTSQFQKYGSLSVVDKVLMSIFIGVLIFFEAEQAVAVMLADTISRFVALAFAGYALRALLIGRGCGFSEAVREFRGNIAAGSSLAVSFVAGMLMVGVGRFVLERFTSVEQFGAYSLAVSTLSLVLVLSMAFGTVLFPTLSRLASEGHARRFAAMRGSVSVSAGVVFGIYFPTAVIIDFYLVDFRSALVYLGPLFCVVYLQMRTQIALDPFFKLMRRERALMAFNVGGLVLTAGLVWLAFCWQGTPGAVAVATLLGVAMRTYVAEVYLARQMGAVVALYEVIGEVVGIGVFAGVSILASGGLTAAVYVLLVVGLALVHRSAVGQLFDSLRHGLRS